MAKRHSAAQRRAQAIFKQAVKACVRKGQTKPRQRYNDCVSAEVKKIKRGR